MGHDLIASYRLVYFQPDPEDGERVCVALLFSARGAFDMLYDPDFPKRGQSFMTVSTFTVKLDSGGRVTTQVSRKEVGVMSYELMGSTSAAASYLDRTAGVFVTDPIGRVKKLVEVAIEGDPANVGPPVRVLLITNKGHR